MMPIGLLTLTVLSLLPDMYLCSVVLLYPVVVSSCKQTVIIKSTIESKLIALDTTYLKAKWIKDLLSEFYIMPRLIPPISVHNDSRSTIEILKQ